MQSALEQTFPRIVDHLLETWPKATEAQHYLDDLLFTGRPERHGFTEEVWMELTFLNDLLRLESPTLPSDLATDIWAIAFAGAERSQAA